MAHAEHMTLSKRTSIFEDRVSLGFAVIGLVLMAATLATGANPIEGSVITPFLKDTVIGNAVLIVLIGTSFPTMLVGEQVFRALWIMGISLPDSLQWFIAVIMPGLIYFGVARLGSFFIEKAKRA